RLVTDRAGWKPAPRPSLHTEWCLKRTWTWEDSRAMRLLILVSWLMLPILVGAYHYGPGQDRLRLDDAAGCLASAERCATDGKWAEAVAAYDDALRLLPPDRVGEARRIRLERAKAMMLARQLPAAHDELKGLVAEIAADKTPDPALSAQARSTLANSQYY